MYCTHKANRYNLLYNNEAEAYNGLANPLNLVYAAFTLR